MSHILHCICSSHGGEISKLNLTCHEIWTFVAVLLRLPLSVNTVWVILGISRDSGEQKAISNLVVIDGQKSVPATAQEALQI